MSKRKTSPIEVTEDGIGGSIAQRFKHPSFGHVVINRVTGTKKLFGSQLQHGEYFSLKIRDCEMVNDLGRLWFFDRNKDHIEIALSATQLLELFSNIGGGHGTQCTILYANKEEIPEPEEKEMSPASAAIQGFAESVGKTIRALESETTKIRELIEDKKPLGQSQKRELVHLLGRVTHALKTNAKFYGDSFIEVSEKVVQSAKAEVESFVRSTLIAYGIKHLSDQGNSIVSLPEWDSTKEARDPGKCQFCSSKANLIGTDHGIMCADCANSGKDSRFNEN